MSKKKNNIYKNLKILYLNYICMIFIFLYILTNINLQKIAYFIKI